MFPTHCGGVGIGRTDRKTCSSNWTDVVGGGGERRYSFLSGLDSVVVFWSVVVAKDKTFLGVLQTNQQ